MALGFRVWGLEVLEVALEEDGDGRRRGCVVAAVGAALQKPHIALQRHKTMDALKR